MYQVWSAIVFGAVGMLSIIFGLDRLTDLELTVLLPRSGFDDWFSKLTYFFAALIIPVLLILFGLRLLFRPPRVLQTDPSENPPSPQGPHLLLLGVIMISGVYHFTHSARYILSAIWWSHFDPKNSPYKGHDPTYDLVTTLVGIYMALGCPYLRKWLVKRLDKIASEASDLMPEKYLAAGLMGIGALLIGSELGNMTHWIVKVLDNHDMFWFARGFGVTLLKLAMGFYLLTGATALRRFQLGKLAETIPGTQADKPAE